LLLSLKRPEAAVIAFRGAQELRADLRSYQGTTVQSAREKIRPKLHIVHLHNFHDISMIGLHLSTKCNNNKENKPQLIESITISGLVHSYLAFSKIKEALHAAREAMKAMPQSAKALKLVGDVHASNSGGREKVVKS